MMAIYSTLNWITFPRNIAIDPHNIIFLSKSYEPFIDTTTRYYFVNGQLVYSYSTSLYYHAQIDYLPTHIIFAGHALENQTQDLNGSEKNDTTLAELTTRKHLSH